MIEISLTRGLVALLDDEDADLADLKWMADAAGYAARNTFMRGGVKIRRLLMHRVIVERIIGRPLLFREYVDHRNKNTTDNRRTNLRIAGTSRNQANRKPNGERPYKGVHQHTNGRWRARVKVDGITHHLGYFDTLEEAARAYDEGAKRFFGEFAQLNFD